MPKKSILILIPYAKINIQVEGRTYYFVIQRRTFTAYNQPSHPNGHRIFNWYGF